MRTDRETPEEKYRDGHAPEDDACGNDGEDGWEQRVETREAEKHRSERQEVHEEETQSRWACSVVPSR